MPKNIQPVECILSCCCWEFAGELVVVHCWRSCALGKQAVKRFITAICSRNAGRHISKRGLKKGETLGGKVEKKRLVHVI